MPKPNIDDTQTQNAYYDYQAYYPNGQMYASGRPSLGTVVTWHLINRRTSVSTPNFRSYKRWNALPKNPYRFSDFRMSDPLGSVNSTNTDGGWQTEFQSVVNTQNYMPVLGQESSAFASDPTQKAVSRLINSIGTAKADAGTSLAEIGKTADHLAHSATRIFNSLRALRKGRFGDFARELGVSYTDQEVLKYRRKHVEAKLSDRKRGFYYSSGEFSRQKQHSRVTDLAADTWLEYTYGWKPLLMDVYNSAEALANTLVERAYVVRTATASARSEDRVSISSGVLSDEVRFLDKITTRNAVKFKVDFRIPNGSISALHAFGLSNPLVVAWEIVPFSFVVDWFLPIGDAISALSAFNGLEFAGGVVMRKSWYKAERKLTFRNWTTGSTHIARNAELGASLISYDQSRELLHSFPAFGFPSFKDPRSIAHGLSAVALLQSLFLRK